MIRREKKKDKEVLRINKILKTLPNHYPSYVMKKKCPMCLQENYKESYFCTFCGATIHKVKIERISREV